MAAKRTPPVKPANPRAKGLKLIGVRLEPAQVAGIKREALRRASARGSGVVDSSEVVREAIRAWLAKRR